MFRSLYQGLFRAVFRPVPRLSANVPHSVDSAAGSNLKFWLDLLAKERLESLKERRQEVEKARKKFLKEKRQEVEEARKEANEAWDRIVDNGAEIVQLKV